MGRFATTIFSLTQRCNVGTVLQPFETMLQHCVALEIVVSCESSRVTSPLALHDFIFCLSKLQVLSRASLLALAKSICYYSVYELSIAKGS